MALPAFLWQLVVAFPVQFSPSFALGAEQSPLTTVGSSIRFVGQNLGRLLLLMITGSILVFIAAMPSLVGLLLAVPVVVIAQAHIFRVLRDEPVVP